MGVYTHVMVYSGEDAVSMSAQGQRFEFLSPLQQFGKHGNWSVTFFALPPGKEYRDIVREPRLEYIQAAGPNPETIMLDIRKPGGEQWGVQWVRYIIGHSHNGESIDVPIELPHGPEFVSRPEVFDAEEAADIFMSYYKTGDIPPGYVLRPVEGYTADHGLVDLRGVTA